MTSQDYIDQRDLTKIECALGVLQDVEAENSTIIDSREFTKVMISLRSWQRALFRMWAERMKKEALEGMSPKT